MSAAEWSKETLMENYPYLPLALAEMHASAALSRGRSRVCIDIHKKYLASWRQSLFCETAANFTRSYKSGLKLDSSVSDVRKSERKTREMSS
jgi:hypothetical protein